MERGYGITSGFWDVIFKTRFPDSVQARLSSRGKPSGLTAPNNQSESLNVAARRF
jgi:hypothetical protein